MYDQPEKKCGTLDLNRDRIEKTLLGAALEKNMPVLGICRGIQLMNAALGGTLHQDLPTEGFTNHTIVDRERNAAAHTVDVKENSLLAVWKLQRLQKKELSSRYICRINHLSWLFSGIRR